jgi:hypothetical protein
MKILLSTIVTAFQYGHEYDTTKINMYQIIGEYPTPFNESYHIPIGNEKYYVFNVNIF